jgi:hypothetical protein
MDLFELIDEKKIAERKAEREAEYAITPEEQVRQAEQIQARIDAAEIGKAALSIVREETGPHYSVTYFDANGTRFTLEQLRVAGGLKE